MSKPTTLSDAVAQLEKAGASKTKDFKDFVEKDFLEVKKALADLKPHLDNLKDGIDKEVKDAQRHIETQVRENPWAALGIVGFVAFLIGLLLGNNRK
jgi:ElaB/YqjD/DUF883 family membrane-anchored ribosome-binding protein